MRSVSDPRVKQQLRFMNAERALVNWWELQRSGAVVFCEYGEWFVEIDGQRFSISEMALAIAQEAG